MKEPKRKTKGVAQAENQELGNAAFAGHHPDDFSSEGYEKKEESAELAKLREIQKEARHEFDNASPDEINCEGHTEKLDHRKEDDSQQADFVDDKEYLASSGGGRSFKYLDEDKEEQSN